MTWRRVTTLDGLPTQRQRERWEKGSAVDCMGFDVDVTVGKPLDVAALKNTSLDETLRYAAFLAATARRLYGPDVPIHRLQVCPCCGASLEGAIEAARIFDVPFHCCVACGHAVVRDQPSGDALHSVFATSDDHAATYVDHASIEIRQTQVIQPKIQWVVDIFQSLYQRAPDYALDVGAGGGHFVAGMRQQGIRTDGIEISQASRAFAKSAFGIDLSNEDFLAYGQKSPEPNLLTFWGLLEYTPEPRRFLDVARRRLSSGQGLLVVEVPRFNCLGTAVQQQTPKTVARHLDPTSHVNTFTDASLVTALVETGFQPVAAWYFGMDVYELLVQIAIRLNDVTVMDRLADFIPLLQASLDQGRQCDDIVVAAIPV